MRRKRSGSTSVSGPGQNRFIKARARGEMFGQRAKTGAVSATIIVIGFDRGRPLMAYSRSTDASISAETAIP